MKTKLYRKRPRKGATTVEFALVAPLVFLFIFSMIEISRLLMCDGCVNSAMLIGLREATLAQSTPASVESVMTQELRQVGIVDGVSIQFDPQDFNANTSELTILVSVPFAGFYIYLPQNVSKSITFARETR